MTNSQDGCITTFRTDPGDSRKIQGSTLLPACEPSFNCFSPARDVKGSSARRAEPIGANAAMLEKYFAFAPRLDLIGFKG